MPILAEYLGGMHGAAGAVTAAHVGDRAVFVAPPADALGVFGIEGKFLGHAAGIAGVGCGARIEPQTAAAAVFPIQVAMVAPDCTQAIIPPWRL